MFYLKNQIICIKVARKFDKVADGLADDTDYNFTFNSNQIFTVLPESELLRLFDNVPRFAKAQTVMGNRLVYGNYVEGYDLKDKNNNPLNLDFDVELISESSNSFQVSSNVLSNTFTITASRCKLYFEYKFCKCTTGKR